MILQDIAAVIGFIIMGGAVIIAGVLLIDQAKPATVPAPTPVPAALGGRSDTHVITFDVPQSFVDLGYQNWQPRKREADGTYAVVPIVDGKPRWLAALLTSYEDPGEAWDMAIKMSTATRQELTSREE